MATLCFSCWKVNCAPWRSSKARSRCWQPLGSAKLLAKSPCSTRARAVILGRAMYERVSLSESLELVLLLDAPSDTSVLTCAELATGGALLVEPRDRDEREPAAIMSGLVTHHALKSRAASVGLTPSTVVLNAAPVYDAAQLSAGILGGATQLLSRDESLDATHVLTEQGLRAAS